MELDEAEKCWYPMHDLPWSLLLRESMERLGWLPDHCAVMVLLYCQSNTLSPKVL